MKKLQQVLIAVVISLFTAIPIFSFGQSSSGNNTPGFTKFLGYDGAQDLEFRTNNTTYMQLMQNGNSTINGFTIDRSGFLGLSQDPTFFTGGVATPFSLLHLNGDNPLGAPQQDGYRDWMRYGITFTHNTDLMYVGPKANANDVTDAVIAWSDNPEGPNPWGPDVLRFLFLDGDGTAPSGAESNEGLELGRMTGTGQTGFGSFWSNSIAPKRTLDVVNTGSEPQFRITQENDEDLIPGVYTDFETSAEGHLHILPWSEDEEQNVGIGFLSAFDNPTERLDVDGTVRLRQMPNESPNVLITGNEQATDPVTGDYVLNYLEFPNDDGVVLAGDGTWIETTGEDCDWEVIENVAGIEDVISGHGNECYPAGHAGVGITVPQAKLDVYHGPNQENKKPDGINSRYDEGTVGLAYEELAAINGTLRRQSGNPLGRGVWGKAYFAKRNYGGDFLGQASNQTTANYGVRGQAFGSTIGPWETYGGYFFGSTPESGQYVYGVLGRAYGGNYAYGVYGSANGAGTAQYAGYFNGDLAYTGSLIPPSDEMLKTNVEDVASALTIVNQLSPKTYNFKTEEYSHMNLPEGTQFGLIAQEVDEILPNLTKIAATPAKYDSAGNEVSPETEYMGVDYIGLIPILTAAVKEQQSIIELQNETLAQVLDQLDDLQQQINNCCSADGAKSFGSDDENARPIFGENILYQNNPNPFHSQTTIRYELEQGGKVMLNIFDRNGKPLATLVEAEQSAGEYRYEWDASGLPAGVYNYALYVDGELLVKKAIKLAD